MTLTEKILAKNSNKTSVSPGEMIWSKVDVMFSHDPCAPGVFSIFEKEFGLDAQIFDKENFILIPDHFIYTADSVANNNIRIMREFAKKHEIKYFYDVGTPKYKGVCHVGIVEGGHVRPGEVLVGTDSHTVTAGALGTFATGIGITDGAFVLGTGEIALKVPFTIKINLVGQLPKEVLAKDIILEVMRVLTVNGATYYAIEFAGETLLQLSVEDRMTICNMVVECGAKNGIIAPDDIVFDFLSRKNITNFEPMYANKNATYAKELTIDVSKLTSLVAKPHSPDNVIECDMLLDTKIEQVYIGSCTGGKTEDFIKACEILYNNKTVIPTFAIPATKDVFWSLHEIKIHDKTLLTILREANVLITSEPSCAACCGGTDDAYGRVELPINVMSTTNRNYLGRMGNKHANIYLGSPYMAAVCAITGKIQNPKHFL